MEMRISTLSVLSAFLATVVFIGSATAQTLGMVADNTTDTVTVFDDGTGTVLGSVALPFGTTVGDCSITGDGSTGFVTDFFRRVWVVDLTGPAPALAAGTNPIPISNFGEDTAISPDGKFLVVCDGSATQPVSVVDIASRTQVSTLSVDPDCNSVDVCSDGSVLISSSTTRNVRRLTLDGTGNLTDTGEVLFSIGTPNNVVCGPGATSGVVVEFFLPQVRSFTIPGLAQVSVQTLSGASRPLSAAVNSAGDTLYTRSNNVVNAFSYDDTTGAIGPALYSPIPISGALTFFGMDQMALNPAGTRLYVSQPNGVDIFDPGSGGFLGSILSPSIVQPTGICFAPKSDSDGDGVPDDLDVCPDTVIPEGVPTRSLGVNRWALVDADGTFDTTQPPGGGNGPDLSFTLDDTAGCSCEQIISALELGNGHTQFGCSISAMEDWVALVNP